MSRSIQTESLFEFRPQASTRDAGKRTPRTPTKPVVVPRADLSAVDGHRVNDAHAWGVVMSEMREILDAEEHERWAGLSADERMAEILVAIPFFEAAHDELMAMPRTSLTAALIIAMRGRINHFLDASTELDSTQSPFVL